MKLVNCDKLQSGGYTWLMHSRYAVAAYGTRVVYQDLVYLVLWNR